MPESARKYTYCLLNLMRFIQKTIYFNRQLVLTALIVIDQHSSSGLTQNALFSIHIFDLISIFFSMTHQVNTIYDTLIFFEITRNMKRKKNINNKSSTKFHVFSLNCNFICWLHHRITFFSSLLFLRVKRCCLLYTKRYTSTKCSFLVNLFCRSSTKPKAGHVYQVSSKNGIVCVRASASKLVRN